MQRPIAIISTGYTFPEIQAACGDFQDWIRAGLGCTATTVHIDAQTLEPAHWPHPSALAGVVITGSHAMVTDREPWSESLAIWLRQAVAAQLPTLGICYGHQLLAHALGGEVGYHPLGMEIGTHTIQLCNAATADPLFAAMPLQFPAQLVHAQSVLHLPTGAYVLARSAHDPHQAFRIGPCAWGVQFHPEFPAQAMQAYLQRLHISAKAPSQHQQVVGPQVTETAAAQSLLAAFAKISHTMRHDSKTPCSSNYAPVESN